jgi:hypothetical protein
MSAHQTQFLPISQPLVDAGLLTPLQAWAFDLELTYSPPCSAHPEELTETASRVHLWHLLTHETVH